MMLLSFKAGLRAKPRDGGARLMLLSQVRAADRSFQPGPFAKNGSARQLSLNPETKDALSRTGDTIGAGKAHDHKAS